MLALLVDDIGAFGGGRGDLINFSISLIFVIR